jgi:hypothetical protein
MQGGREKMFKGAIIFAVLIGLTIFILLLSPDLYEMIIYRAAPDEICEMVDIGEGLFKVADCNCECKISAAYIFLVFGISISTTTIPIMLVFFIVTGILSILRKL